MKQLLATSLLILLGVGPCLAERAVPFEKINFRTAINADPDTPWFEQEGKFHVTTTVNLDPNQGPSSNIQITCSRPFYYLGGDDLTALTKITEAKSNKKEIIIEVPHISMITKDVEHTLVYRSAKSKEGGWDLTLTHEKGILTLDTAEIDKLMDTHMKAKAAALWYDLLLISPQIPKPTFVAKPPPGKLDYFHGQIGTCSQDNIHYQVDLKELNWGNLPDGIIHSIQVPTSDGGQPVLEGDWVRAMMIHVTHAAAAAQKQEAYSFVGKHNSLRYEVRADPNAKTAKLRIHPYFGNSDLYFQEATYSLDSARKIASLINSAEKSKKWFEDNQELFATKPE